MSSSATIWMGDINPGVTEEMVAAVFTIHEEQPIYVKMGRPTVTNANGAGYCFVTFGSAEQAERVLATLNGKPIVNFPGLTRFKLNYAAHKAQLNRPLMATGGNTGAVGGFRAKSQFSVYVGNLAQTVNNRMLFDLFQAKCPNTIISAHSYLDSQGIKRYGFVNFTDESEMDKALEFDGTAELASGEGGYGIRVNRTQNQDRPRQNMNPMAPQGYDESYQDYYQQQYMNPAASNYGLYYNQNTWGGQQYAGTQYYNPSQMNPMTQMVSADPNSELQPTDLHTINDYEKLNRLAIARDELAYQELEQSRWSDYSLFTVPLPTVW